MNRAAEARKTPEVESDADTTASLDGARPEDRKPPEDKTAPLAAADLSSVPPVASRSGFLLAGLALSVLLHLGALVYAQWNSQDEVGPGGRQLQTVEIDLITVSAWLAGRPNQGADTGADADDQDKKDKSEAARRDVTETPPPEGLVKPTVAGSELAAAEIIKPDPVLDRRDEEIDKERPERPEEPGTSNDASGRAKQAQEAREAQFKSGSFVGATPGQISRYGLSVRAALNRNRPLYFGTDGRVVVEFWVTETGRVHRVQIARSSGMKDLDDAAVRSIQKTQFPAPPDGMTEKQRGFRVPFEFRLRQ